MSSDIEPIDDRPEVWSADDDPLAEARETIARETQPPVLREDPPAGDVSRDERAMAALAHLSTLFLGAGLVISGLIYLTRRRAAPYTSFQAAQATAYHLAAAGLTWGVWSLVGAVASTIIGVVLLCVLGPLALVLTVTAYGYPLWAAYETWYGRPFEYVVIGPLVRDWITTYDRGERRS